MVNDMKRVCSTASDLQTCVADHLRKTRQSLAAWLAAQGHL
jgi:hypothetical protein